ncbi:MAG: hypothetical protein M1816_002070 [Peltula sp. TS41687]|nr:MAG: hypothetical protein M1816_002070 [Peltula sp. TS41687]
MTSSVPKVPIPRNGVDYRNKVVLAPMVRSGELPTRLLALRYGADLVWGPETIDRAMIGTTRRVSPHSSTVDFVRFPSNGKAQKESVIFSTLPQGEKDRLVFQMGTSSPERAVQAGKIVAADVAGIDVNAGCPKPFSVSGGMGAALLKTPDLLCSILEALVKEVGVEYEIGISVKIRLLETPEMTEGLVRKLCATGITGLTIHCRTTPMRPRERAIRDQLRMIAGICRENGVACLMNGDVEDRDHALQLMEEYQVDGAMIATCAEKNPSCFRSKADGGAVPWDEIVPEYVKIALQVDNRWGNTKFLLGQFIPGKQRVYNEVMRCRSHEEVCEVLRLDDLGSLAKEVDERRGINANSESGKRSKDLIESEGLVENQGRKTKRAKLQDEMQPLVTEQVVALSA